MPKFVPRQRKHKILQRQKPQGKHSRDDSSDANAAEILPDATAQREKKKIEIKAALRREQPAMSSKKKKRLDKYIVGTMNAAYDAIYQYLS